MLALVISEKSFIIKANGGVTMLDKETRLKAQRDDCRDVREKPSCNLSFQPTKDMGVKTGQTPSDYRKEHGLV